MVFPQTWKSISKTTLPLKSLDVWDAEIGEEFDYEATIGW